MIIIAFIPWFLFWVMLAAHKSEPGAVAAFAASVIVAVISLARGKGVKILQIAGVFFFAVMSFLAAIADLDHSFFAVRISSGLYLATVAFISVLVKRPFTRQFFYEKASKEIRSSREFTRANIVISLVWCVAFLAQTTIPFLRLMGLNPPKMLGPVVSILITLIGIKFTYAYLKNKQLLK